PAGKFAGVSVKAANGAAVVRVAADGEIAHYTLTELKNPARLALDLHGISGKAAKAPGAGLVKSVRVAKHDEGVRVVVDADGETMPKYDVTRRADGLEVRVGEEKIAEAPKAAPEPKAAP